MINKIERLRGRSNLKKILLYALVLLLIVQFASATITYVETPDNIYYNSTAGGRPAENPDNIFDTNWSSYGGAKSSPGEDNTFVSRFNYTNIGLGYDSLNVTARIKHNSISELVNNASLPESCINTSVIGMQVYSVKRRDGLDECGVQLKCYNGSDWYMVFDTIKVDDPCGMEGDIYEEGLFFNMTNSTPPTISEEALSFSTSLLTFAIITLVMFGLVLGSKFGKYAVYVLIIGSVGFGLWFLQQVIV